MGKKQMRWYAVIVGRKTGIFHGWNEEDCAEDHVKGVPGAKFKGFDSKEEAKAWVDRMSANTAVKPPAVKREREDEGPSPPKTEEKTRETPPE